MKKLTVFLLSIFVLSSCEKEIDVVIPNSTDKIVVFGQVESGLPAYLTLSKTLNIYNEISAIEVQNSYLSGAKVYMIVNGTDSVNFFEISLPTDSLTLPFGSDSITIPFPSQLFSAANTSSGIQIPFYIANVLDSAAWGRENSTYELFVEVDNKKLSAFTSIPKKIKLDSIWFIPHPDETVDSLVNLMAKYQDEAVPGQYARLFTQRNSEPFWPFRFGSVFNDQLVNGSEIVFSVGRGDNPNEELNQDNFSYFSKGDTVRIKWSSIDKFHYDFWATLEADRNGNDSPFSAPVEIKSNINGGLGIWGGLGSNYYEIIAPQ